MTAAHRLLRSACVAAAAACAILVGGCGESATPGASADPRADLDIHRYVVRGSVISLPSELDDFMVKHEAIPEFKNPDGSTGMNVMGMPFWPPQGGGGLAELAPEQLPGLDAVAPGDPVAVTFEVAFESYPDGFLGYYATGVEKLPEGTELDFTPLPPAASAAPEEPESPAAE